MAIREVITMEPEAPNLCPSDDRLMVNMLDGDDPELPVDEYVEFASHADDVLLYYPSGQIEMSTEREWHMSGTLRKWRSAEFDKNGNPVAKLQPAGGHMIHITYDDGTGNIMSIVTKTVYRRNVPQTLTAGPTASDLAWWAAITAQVAQL